MHTAISQSWRHQLLQSVSLPSAALHTGARLDSFPFFSSSKPSVSLCAGPVVGTGEAVPDHRPLGAGEGEPPQGDRG